MLCKIPFVTIVAASLASASCDFAKRSDYPNPDSKWAVTLSNTVDCGGSHRLWVEDLLGKCGACKWLKGTPYFGNVKSFAYNELTGSRTQHLQFYSDHNCKHAIKPGGTFTYAKIANSTSKEVRGAQSFMVCEK
ncbi:hypothetical protein BV22DRAFT_1037410 [Leucogyrophana mollusca]|uniref:Uncharacterized protein n=1 Tax=Leucogyrophana mollusca TaxID=85980 RepID=A0ACB8B9M4_9AGAM|nr:hypothetical protein BV22DRAFT_1037410 [Leucogyrophana mollusca]